MVGDDGQVLGLEKHKELAHRSMQSLQQAVPDLMKKGTIKIMPGNVLGKVLGEYGPFDAIHVGAAAATMPQVSQLFLTTSFAMNIDKQNCDQSCRVYAVIHFYILFYNYSLGYGATCDSSDILDSSQMM